MARTIPATFSPVDPSTLLTGEPLKADRVASLAEAVNWSLAHVARAPVIAQAWAETAGSVPCARTSAVPATVAEWTIPELEGGAVVSVVVIARVRSGVAGSSHSVTVQSVNGADSFTVNAVSGLDATWKAYAGSLDVAFLLSRETIRRMRSRSRPCSSTGPRSRPSQRGRRRTVGRRSTMGKRSRTDPSRLG